MIYALENLVRLTVTPCEPWGFKPVQPVDETVKTDKVARQEWYKNPEARHNFYTGVEAVNAGQRVSKSNPPCAIHWLAYDIDLHLDDDRMEALIATLKFTPQWWERSLGGNQRLLFKLETPIRVGSLEYAAFVLEKFQALLGVSKRFPGVDTAYKDPARLYCNGCEWHKVSDCVISSETVQAVLMEVVQEYNFRGDSGIEIPLATVEAELRKKFPNFDWPGAFECETQGPSFWIPESTSPQSAIVKKDGMFTFSAHATKPFYGWSDLLGKEFTDSFRAKTLSASLTDVWFDGNLFYYRVNGPDGKPSEICHHSEKEFRLYLKLVRGISDRRNKDGESAQDDVVGYAQVNRRIGGIKPFLFNPNSLVMQDGKTFLNTYEHRPILPADGTATWGAAGQFPFISRVLDQLLDPKSQLDWLLAWYKLAYQSCLNCEPTPGQVVFIAGLGGTGKTLTCRQIFGAPLGGFGDASSFLTGNDPFGGELFSYGLWCMDDETLAANESVKNRFGGNVKRLVSNADFVYNQKFVKAAKVNWLGRITITLNLDLVSCRSLLQPDENTKPKYAFLRGAQAPTGMEWPSQAEIRALIAAELPFFLRWLVDWEIPATIQRDPRYGIESYHHPLLLDRARQSGRESQFREVLDITLGDYFSGGRESWSGTSTRLQLLIYGNPQMQEVLRSLKVEQVSRYLEQLHREKYMDMSCDVCGNTRTWTFQCPEELKRKQERRREALPPTGTFDA